MQDRLDSEMFDVITSNMLLLTIYDNTTNNEVAYVKLGNQLCGFELVNLSTNVAFTHLHDL